MLLYVQKKKCVLVPVRQCLHVFCPSVIFPLVSFLDQFLETKDPKCFGTSDLKLAGAVSKTLTLASPSPHLAERLDLYIGEGSAKDDGPMVTTSLHFLPGKPSYVHDGIEILLSECHREIDDAATRLNVSIFWWYCSGVKRRRSG